ncbi:OsmC family protein [Pseudogulbenkiania subflava]|uniref:Putative redox protein n=1 Tax=Pseudogulbenkiania subflava DSM 22618 TaxID=1123014 RepID=A0A1Y6CD70_9NEIS|nr:OsmC family protein [Pseudogulbenkiania subflava]SMF57303.1 putative redox protein [Pseudogulbenkiania subflava DSM 22618]
MKQIASVTVTSTPFNYTQLIDTADFELLADEPVSSGGQNAGPAPYDYLLASLGSCTAITLRMYAEKKGWNLGELHITLNLAKDSEGNTFIERQLHSNAPLTDEQWTQLLAVAAKTPVTKTLLQGAKISTARNAATRS